jgi:hypothetical protein
VEKNQVLDEVPFTNSSKHKFRPEEKGLLAMHYKPQTALERLELQLRNQQHN